MITKKEASKYIIIAITLLLVILSIFIIKPFVSTLLLAALLAFIFHPLYKKLTKYVKYKYLSSTIITFGIVLIIAAPLIGFSYLIIEEALAVVQNGTLSAWTGQLTNMLGQGTLAEYLPNILDEGFKFLATTSSAMLIAIPKYFLNMMIMVFSIFFLLVTGEDIMKKVEEMLPFKNKKQLLKSLKETIHAIIYGFFVIAIVGFLIALVGLKIINVPGFALWALLIGVLILLPGVGSTVVYIPMTIYYLVTGNYWAGVGVFILGAILTAVETFGRPYLIGKKATINPVLIIFGIFGGLVMFGAVGLVIGPVILTITISLIKNLGTKDETKN